MSKKLFLLRNLITKFFFPIFVIIALMVSSIHCHSNRVITVIPKTLDYEVEALISKVIPDAFVGIMITDAQTGRLLYQKNAHQYFTPASVMKLFTAAAALYHLTPDYTYQTSISVGQTAPIHHLFKGNLYIKFSGDPSLTRGNLESLVKKVRELGIKKIQGNVVLDQTVFSAMPYPQGIVLDNTQWGFGAPVTSIIINRNSVPITINPAKTLNKPASIAISGKEGSYFPLKNQVKTVTIEQANEKCAFNVVMSENNEITVQGCWPINKDAYKKIAIKNPTLFATQIIRDALKKENIELTGHIVTGKIEGKQKIIAGHLSKPLSAFISHTLHFSDNVYANAIFKTLGVNNTGQNDFFSGRSALTKILSKYTDIDFQRMKIFDGAGMSTYNKITPYHLNQLLDNIYRSPQIKDTFLAAMAEPGASGTLSSRMNAVGLQSSVRAKSGYMQEAQTLAGYLKISNNKTVIFSLMINHYTGAPEIAKKLEDQLLSIIKNTTEYTD